MCTQLFFLSKSILKIKAHFIIVILLPVVLHFCLVCAFNTTHTNLCDFTILEANIHTGLTSKMLQ